MSSTLPASVLSMVRFLPIEDVLLPILRAGLPDVRCQSLIEASQEFPMVLVRRLPDFGNQKGDPRFTDVAMVAIHTFAEGVNGDEDAALLGDAVHTVLFNAGQRRDTVPGRGQIVSIEAMQLPRRTADWATSAGPVQYADLPTGVWRYEALYEVEVRRPLTPIFPSTP